MRLMDIYNNLPIMLQNIACTCVGKNIQRKRYNNQFVECWNEAIRLEHLSADEKCVYRDQKIAEIVEYAYFHVPYYKKKWDELGINYKEINSLDKLNRLPIINKREVVQNRDAFLSNEYIGKKNNVNELHTSGTTGAGLNLKMTREAEAMNWAIGWREHNRIGITRDMWCAYFAGRPIVPARQEQPPFYRINEAGKQIMFSCFHLNDKSFLSYVDELNKRQPMWFHGYPSVIGLLAKYMVNANVDLAYQPKVITLSSETVTMEQREYIRKAFNVNPLQTYGQTECVAYFRDYIPEEIYVVEDYSAAEFVNMGDGLTHIVGTNFYNKAMPLIRYDTHDLASCIETPHGRKVIKIDGRVEDYITLSDGSKIGRMDHIFKGANHVVEAQIVQKSLNELWINIVKDSNYSDKDEKEIQTLLKERIGNRIMYRLNYVEKIPRTANGKIRFVVSEI